MDVINKFDGTVLGEVEMDTPRAGKSTKETLIEPLSVVNILLEELSSMLNDEGMMRVYSCETGKSISSCRREVEFSKLYLLSYAYPEIYRYFGHGRLLTSAFRNTRRAYIHRGIPILSMCMELIDSIGKGQKIEIIHPAENPMAPMTLTEKLVDSIHGYDHILEETAIGSTANIQSSRFNPQDTISVWGKGRKITSLKPEIDVRYRSAGNFSSIVRDHSQVEKAVNASMNLSFNSISNIGFSGQVYFIPDREFIYFKNRLSEMLKRTAPKLYSPDSGVNYYSGKSEVEKSKDSVKHLLENGWDYVDDLPATVHVLTLQYGEIPEIIPEINGPIILLAHYASLKESADMALKMWNPSLLNMYTDSINDVEYMKQRFGSSLEICVNGMDERDIFHKALISPFSYS